MEPAWPCPTRAGFIHPPCEDALRELERRGYEVRRVGGYAAIDQARNQLATDALLDGFEETMWIDADLGFDPLLDPPGAGDLARALARRRAPIKSVLLDQGLFAGVGNWIADEVLYQARLRPQRLASDLELAEVRRLRARLVAIVARAVAVDADADRFPRTWLFHRRWGKDARARTARGERIVHETIGGRTAAWVPARQR